MARQPRIKSERTVLESDFHTAVAVGNMLLAAWEKHRNATHTALVLGPCAACVEADAAIAIYRETNGRIVLPEADVVEDEVV